jgi:hypothetical protein
MNGDSLSIARPPVNGDRCHASSSLVTGRAKRDKAPGVGPQGTISHVRGGNAKTGSDRAPLPPLAPSVSLLFEIVPEDPARKKTCPAAGAAPARGALDPGAWARTPNSVPQPIRAPTPYPDGSAGKCGNVRLRGRSVSTPPSRITPRIGGGEPKASRGPAPAHPPPRPNHLGAPLPPRRGKSTTPKGHARSACWMRNASTSTSRYSAYIKTIR